MRIFLLLFCFFYCLNVTGLDQVERERLESKASTGDASAQVALGKFHAGEDNYDPDFEQAISLFMEAAANDDPEAAYCLGVMNANGLGVEQDYAEAASWYKTVADTGHMRAARNLATLYEAGLGVTRDFSKAKELHISVCEKFPILTNSTFLSYSFFDMLSWAERRLHDPRSDKQAQLIRDFQKSGYETIWDYYYQGEDFRQDDALLFERLDAHADGENDGEAHLVLAMLIKRGQGVQSDDAEMLQHIKLAADAGNAVAQYRLSMMYRHGFGKFIKGGDARNADLWLEKSAENGFASAQNFLGMLYLGAIPDEIDPDLEKGIALKRKAAEQGNEIGILSIAERMTLGIIPGETERAREMLEKAAQNGKANCADILWHYLRSGTFGAKDYLPERTYCEKNPDAMRPYDLAEMYELDSHNVQADYKKALENYRRAESEKPSPHAEAAIGRFYELGLGVEQDYDEAIAWFEKALKHKEKSAEAGFRLGKMYFDGRGFRRNMEKARTLFAEAAERNSSAALWAAYMMRYGLGGGSDAEKADALYKTTFSWLKNLPEIRERAETLGLRTSSRQAAGQGDPEALYDFALLGLFGDDEAAPDIDAADRFLNLAAEKGHTPSQYLYGSMLLNARFMEQDWPRAHEWLRIAAESGHVPAQIALAASLVRPSTPGFVSDGIEWYRKAAENGNVDAQRALGDIYSANTKIAPDYAQAIAWYEKAAAQEDRLSEYELGLLHAKGKGVEKSLRNAIKRFRQAARDKDVFARVAKYLTRENIDKEKLSRGSPAFWDLAVQFHELIERGNADASVLVARMYAEGVGERKDRKKPLQWFEKAVDRGDVSGLLGAGDRLSGVVTDGAFVSNSDLDYGKAMEYYKEAAGMGNAQAMYRVGFMYNSGRGVTEDPVEAGKWFEKGAQKGSNAAKGLLGTFLFNGFGGMTQNMSKGVEYWIAAGEALKDGSFLAAAALAHENGDGVRKDVGKAIHFFLQAKQYGEKEQAPRGLERLIAERGKYENLEPSPGQYAPEDIAGVWSQRLEGKHYADFLVKYNPSDKSYAITYHKPEISREKHGELTVDNVRFTGKRLTFNAARQLRWLAEHDFVDLRRVNRYRYEGDVNGKKALWIAQSNPGGPVIDNENAFPEIPLFVKPAPAATPVSSVEEPAEIGDAPMPPSDNAATDSFPFDEPAVKMDERPPVDMEKEMQRFRDMKIVASMDRVVASGVEVTLPPEVYVDYAAALLRMGRPEDAKRQVDEIIMRTDVPFEVVQRAVFLRADIREVLNEKNPPRRWKKKK